MTTRFADRLNRFLGRVTHKCAETDEDYSHVFSTRYTAYRRQDIIVERKDGWLFDHDFDFTENSFLTMTLIDDKFASTFRIHVASKLSEPLPSRGVFEDLIDPHLAAGLTVVDPTRLAARLDDARTYPELPFIALRPAWLAAEHFDADIVLATVAVRAHAVLSTGIRLQDALRAARLPESALQDRLHGPGFPGGEAGGRDAIPVFPLDALGTGSAVRRTEQGARLGGRTGSPAINRRRQSRGRTRPRPRAIVAGLAERGRAGSPAINRRRQLRGRTRLRPRAIVAALAERGSAVSDRAYRRRRKSTPWRTPCGAQRRCRRSKQRAGA